jgi:hypothetical protein
MSEGCPEEGTKIMRKSFTSNQKQTSLERSLGFHLLDHRVRKRLVKLSEHVVNARFPERQIQPANTC